MPKYALCLSKVYKIWVFSRSGFLYHLKYASISYRYNCAEPVLTLQQNERKKKTLKKSKTDKIAIVLLSALLFASLLLTTALKPATAQYWDTKNQYHSTMGGPLPSGVTPDTSVTTAAYLAVTPNPVGIGQTMLVNVWTTPGIDVSRYHTGYTVTITKPDATTETKTMNSYYADSTAWFNYVPEQLGVYKFQFSYAGDYYAAGTYTMNKGAVFLFGGNSQNVTFAKSAWYKPSTSPVTTITVQQDLVMSWPPSPLPTDYWTRPISPENREWWSIAGNYPATGQVGGGAGWPDNTNPYGSLYGFVPYVQGPNTAHVAWRMPIGDAGLIGGNKYTNSFLGGGFGAGPSVIYNGRGYQQISQGGSSNLLECYDIRTGKVYWQIANPVPSSNFFGFVFAGSLYISYYLGTAEVPGGSSSSMSAGVSLVSIGSQLVKIDPFSGAITLNVTGMSGTYYNDPYVLSVQSLGSFFAPNYRLINWSIAGSTTNFADRIVSNISWPLSSLPSTTDFNTGVTVSISGISDSGVGSFGSVGTMLTAYSLQTGQMLWNTTDNEIEYSLACCIADHGKVAVLFENGGWKAWDLLTGKVAWTSQPMDYPWGLSSFGDYGQQSAYGLLYRESYDGVYAFDWATGKIVWHFVAPSVPFETPYSGNYSFNGGGIVADGKLYTYNTEHTASNPITRGWRMFCINATTGEGIWNITGTTTPMAVADGYLAASDGYDGYMYVFGKGQSATTVSAPQIQVTVGTSAVLSGTVLDESPGSPGTPCVSAASMTTYMEYLYMQHPIDGIFHNDAITGIPVSLDAVDPNGNNVHIATVTTDGKSGTFGYTWTPTTVGQYKIIATFAGDDSYGSSSATTYATVAQAAQSTTPETVTQTAPDYTMTIVGVGIAVIIAVAIAAVAIILMVRKR